MAELYIKTEDGEQVPLWLDSIYKIETEESILKCPVLNAIADDGSNFYLEASCEFGEIKVLVNDIKHIKLKEEETEQ